jgi:DNA-binding transcriptional LysR family regulator
MDWTIRELRFFVTAVDTGSFTDAAAELYVSQAAVSRTIASLEKAVGARVLRRSVRGCEPTSVGQQVLPQARKVLAEADRLSDFLQSRPSLLRVGYAWAALGQHTSRLQREWTQRHPADQLELVRHNSPTAGLAEGLCDSAVTRRALDDARFESVVVGLERRLVAFPSDDPEWQRRRQLTMAEIAERVVVVDPRVGTTSTDLWNDSGHKPRTIETADVDTWLDAIAAGRGVGTTAEATAHHHPRPGVTYRPIKDGPRIPVRLAWWRDAKPERLTELIDAVTALYVGA